MSSKKETLDEAIDRKNSEIRQYQEKLEIEMEEKKKFQSQMKLLEEKLAQKVMEFNDLIKVILSF